MGSSDQESGAEKFANTSAHGLSAPFVDAFRARATDGCLRFDDFVRLALYHPSEGYYARPRTRVGYGPDTDFFTASTSGPVFGELVSAACLALLGDRDPAEFTFVEVGAEAGRCILDGVDHPFAGARAIGVTDEPVLTGKCVVFSNELFDAQPFRRLRFREGSWRELGVRLGSDQLFECECASGPPLPGPLPAIATPGYTIDAPVAAAELARSLAEQSWSGLFLAFDYGKLWAELATARPAGTARTYFRHRQGNDLLARPGEQDLTCHICWDWIEDALRQNGFRDLKLESQESFLIRNGATYLAGAIAEDAARLTRRKQSLLQLLHGSHLGQKFQVLHGVRD